MKFSKVSKIVTVIVLTVFAAVEGHCGRETRSQSDSVVTSSPTTNRKNVTKIQSMPNLPGLPSNTFESEALREFYKTSFGKLTEKDWQKIEENLSSYKEY